jgi:hypothetical protein
LNDKLEDLNETLITNISSWCTQLPYNNLSFTPPQQQIILTIPFNTDLMQDL